MKKSTWFKKVEEKRRSDKRRKGAAKSEWSVSLDRDYIDATAFGDATKKYLAGYTETEVRDDDGELVWSSSKGAFPEVPPLTSVSFPHSWGTWSSSSSIFSSAADPHMLGDVDLRDLRKNYDDDPIVQALIDALIDSRSRMLTPFGGHADTYSIKWDSSSTSSSTVLKLRMNADGTVTMP